MNIRRPRAILTIRSRARRTRICSSATRRSPIKRGRDLCRPARDLPLLQYGPDRRPGAGDVSADRREAGTGGGQRRCRRVTSNKVSASVPAPLAGTYTNPVLDADFPDPGGDSLAADGFYYAYATQTLARREMDQHPGRAVGGPRPLAPSWGRASRKAELGARRRRISGRLTSSTTASVPHVLFGDA